MGPRAVQISAQTFRRRLPSLYQSSVLLRPLARPQNSPHNATHCSHRFTSMSSVSAPTSAPAIGQQPLPWDYSSSHLWASAMSLTKCFQGDLPLEGFGVCTARRRLTHFLGICPVHGQRTENPKYLPISDTRGSSSFSRTSSQATSITLFRYRSTSSTLPMSEQLWIAFLSGIFSSSPISRRDCSMSTSQLFLPSPKRSS